MATKASKADTCPVCGARVKAANLDEHLERVHPGEAVASAPRRKARSGTARRRWTASSTTLAIVFAVLAAAMLVGAVLFFFQGVPSPLEQKYAGKSITDICLSGGEGQGLHHHWHATLTITINGNPFPIPGTLGQSPCLRPLHMHGADGRIHIESEVPLEVRDFTLGDFFEMWGKAFGSTRIDTYEVDGSHTLQMAVNGQANTQFENLPLRDGQAIQIVYGPV